MHTFIVKCMHTWRKLKVDFLENEDSREKKFMPYFWLSFSCRINSLTVIPSILEHPVYYDVIRSWWKEWRFNSLYRTELHSLNFDVLVHNTDFHASSVQFHVLILNFFSLHFLTAKFSVSCSRRHTFLLPSFIEY